MFMNTVRSILKLLQIGLILIQISACLTATTSTAWSQSPEAPKNTKPAQPETAGKPKSTTEKPEFTRFELMAIDMLRDSGSQARLIDDKRSSAKLQTQAADALWKYDTPRSRELLESAFDMALEHYRTTKDRNRILPARNLSVPLLDVRLEVIKVASARDPELGRKLSKKYQEERKRELQAEGGSSNGLGWGVEASASSELLKVSAELLDQDKSAASDLAKQAVQSGADDGVANHLFQIAGKDRKLADRVFVQALEAARFVP